MSAESTAVLLRLPPDLHLTDDQLYELCRLNRELRIERTAQGGLVIMAPAGGDTSDKNAEITMQLRLWAKRDGTGRTFDSSGGFVVKGGEKPDQRAEQNTATATVGVRWSEGVGIRLGAAGAGNAERA